MFAASVGSRTDGAEGLCQRPGETTFSSVAVGQLPCRYVSAAAPLEILTQILKSSMQNLFLQVQTLRIRLWKRHFGSS